MTGVDQTFKSGFNIKNKTYLYHYVELVFEKSFLINKAHPTYDKTPVRDFIYIEDLVKIHYLIGKLIKKKKKF